ncbi:MAG: hypothetical protein E4H02_08615 [Lentisphaerales bacterium]|jgi:hypothetical protein|nr:MAG: hypothetical protein E4H02_08615 [Lentisphaerales bacterium]
MDIEVFTLCDAATDSGGKLNLLGAFDSIFTKSLPAVHPQCAIALRLRFSRIEAGKHKIKISLIDADGKPVVAPFDAEMNVAFKGGEASLAANVIMNLQRLQVREEGEYSIDLAIDGRHEKSVPLLVKVAAQKKN